MKDLLYVAYIHGGMKLYNDIKDIITSEPHNYRLFRKDGEVVGAVLVRKYSDNYTNLVCMHVTNRFTIDMWRYIRKHITTNEDNYIISIVDNFKTLERFANLYNGIRVGSTLIFRKEDI